MGAAYARLIGRFRAVGRAVVERAGVRAGRRVLSAGCGPGALTAPLVHRLGADAVSATDPSAPFVAAIGARFPNIDVRFGVAEHLPLPDQQCRPGPGPARLVVRFMADPVRGLREMARVTRPDGVVAACGWDHAREPRSPRHV